MEQLLIFTNPLIISSLLEQKKDIFINAQKPTQHNISALIVLVDAFHLFSQNTLFLYERHHFSRASIFLTSPEIETEIFLQFPKLLLK